MAPWERGSLSAAKMGERYRKKTQCQIIRWYIIKCAKHWFMYRASGHKKQQTGSTLQNLSITGKWIIVKSYTLFKTLGSRIVFYFYERSLYYCEILLQFKTTVFYINIFYNVIYSSDESWIFSIITPVFSVTWFFRNQYNMILCSINISDNCWKQSFFFLWNLSLWLLIKLIHPCWIKVIIYLFYLLTLFS